MMRHDDIEDEQYGRRVALAIKVEGMKSEIVAIHRENIARDKIITDIARDMKDLLALANKGKGGLWAGMAIASALGGIVTLLIEAFFKR